MELKDIHSLVQEQVKFAESKNASLVAYNGVLIFGLMRIVEVSSEPSFHQFLLVICVLTASFSLLKSLYSFMPNLTPSKGSGSENNTLYFDHIKEVEVEEYLATYRSKTKGSIQGLESDIVNQIISISKIASQKHANFKVALITSLFATLVGGFLLFIQIA